MYNAESIILISESLCSAGLYDDALEKLEKIINDKKNNYLAYINIGYIYHIMGDYDKSIENYKISLQKKITASAYFNIGLSYLKLNNISKSKEFFIKCLDLNPSHHKALVQIERMS